MSKGMEFSEGYYPLSLVKSILSKNLNPFDAYDELINNPNKSFIPNFSKFISAFQEFLFFYINEEKEYIFKQIISSKTNNVNKFLVLLNLKIELSGIDLPYDLIIRNLIDQNVPFQEFREKLLENVHIEVQKVIRSKELGSTNLFDLKKMRHTPFVKYINQILEIRKNEFEKTVIYKISSRESLSFDVSVIIKTYYGDKISRMLSLSKNTQISGEKFNKFLFYASKLNLILNVEEKNT
ncbi:MAG: hypothetical protein EU533_04240 [Promethearchaeota archaeon]|nr:MAG: hypothetical protein EU533_04240 [Candidatus Lokiarchaeota archaeon]